MDDFETSSDVSLLSHWRGIRRIKLPTNYGTDCVLTNIYMDHINKIIMDQSKCLQIVYFEMRNHNEVATQGGPLSISSMTVTKSKQ